MSSEENPLGALRVVRMNPTCADDAIDWENPSCNLVEYFRTRDAKHLAFKAGREPVWFTVERLPARFLSSVLEGIFPIAFQRETAFLAAVHLVEGPGAEPLRVWRKAAAPQNARFVSLAREFGVEMAPDAWLQEIVDLYAAETVQELGQVAIDLCKLPKAGPRRFSSWAGTAAGR